jgi:uncharacterized protein (DUF2147 family)
LAVNTIKAALTLLLAAVLPALPGAALGADADAIVGLWDTQDKDAKIEIFKCDLEYCGRIAHLEEPTYSPDEMGGMADRPKVDRFNPDPALRKRPLVGLRFMEGFRYKGGNTWDGGRIYNPENGKFYKARISLRDGRRLMLRGYWGISLLGRTEVWVRSYSDPTRGCLYNARGDSC